MGIFLKDWFWPTAAISGIDICPNPIAAFQRKAVIRQA
jgi:hypothetical protein